MKCVAVIGSLLALALSGGKADAAPLPWEGGPTVETPAETQMANIASVIAGRPVHVRCNGAHDWSALVNRPGFNPAWLGFVYQGWDYTELSPAVCGPLAAYAEANPKPAYWCSAEVGEKWKTVKVRGRINPKLVRVPIMAAAPCPNATALKTAMHILAHEAVHLSGVIDETETDRIAATHIGLVALMLGASPAQAAELARTSP